MATTFGLDISHHQPDSLNLGQARAEGCEFVIIKAGEGTGADDRFAANLAKARAAGQLVAAYWYQRSAYSAAAHVAGIARTVPKDVPVIPDVESGSGGADLTRDIVNQARAAGYRVPLVYLPRWYWQQIGSPSLAGLPPLWSSRYPDYTVRGLGDAYAKAPGSYWDGYGGLPVALLQFTSSARVAGYAPLDANAYRGSRDQLAALLGAAVTTEGEDEDMANAYSLLVPAGTNEHVVLPCPGPGPMAWYVYAAFGRTVRLHQCAFVMETPKTGTAPEFVPNAGWGWDPAKDETWTIDPDRPGHLDIPRHPDGRQPVGISLRYTADHSFTVARG